MLIAAPTGLPVEKIPIMSSNSPINFTRGSSWLKDRITGDIATDCYVSDRANHKNIPSPIKKR